ncbi:MAG: class I SAM-dependent methyltransferase [Candidatus Aceula meridiana]|nr:class I SAM-dependent methyltransferase [Candidatus Aceula meridiana]
MKCRRPFSIIKGIPVLLPKRLEQEQLLALDVWGKEYRELLEKKDFECWDKYCSADVALIKETSVFNKEKDIFLELGCGKARNCAALLKKGYKNVIGADICLDACILASEICEHYRLTDYFFLVADIYKPPLKRNTIDLIFAGGSIEHFRDTLGGLRKTYDILRTDGKLVATVPYVSVSTLLQGFLTGNVPRLPILGSFYEFFHTKIMKNKNLMYGFEYSFTWRELRTSLKKIGFIVHCYGLYDVEYDLKFIPCLLKRIFLKIIRFKLFWPMIYFCAAKSERKK